MSTPRHKAREVALQMLYQKDLNPEATPEAIREQIGEVLSDEQMGRFAWGLFAGTMETRKIIDQRIEAVSANWTLSRMPPTDRNTIRLGAYELLFTATPHAVVIDEALELAKSFGGPNSTSFVNGILDKLVPDEKRSSSPATTDDNATE